MARIALCQMKHHGSMQKNLEQSLQAIREASGNHADLILFPEVQLTEFFPQYPNQDVKQYAVSADSQITKAFQKTCRECHIMAVPNLYLKEKESCYDASLLIDRNGEILGIQKMVHIAQATQFYEQDYYTPSDDGFHIFETDIGKIGIVVCFDRHYPESIRTEALMGAELILIPTVNVTSEPLTMFEWEIRVQAFQNSTAIAMCNRTGAEENMHFSGESVVVGANGDIIARADKSEAILYADLELQQSTVLRHQKPYTSLRRKNWYL